MFSALSEFKSCDQHRSLVVILCGIIQAVTLKCPTALVWRCMKLANLPQISDSKAVLFKGSPLDLLPCAPSSLFSFFLSSDDAVQEEEQRVSRYIFFPCLCPSDYTFYKVSIGFIVIKTLRMEQKCIHFSDAFCLTFEGRLEGA